MSENPSEENVTSIIVGGGSSTRMGFDKLFAQLGNQTVIEHSIHAFIKCSFVSNLIIAISNKSRERLENIVAKIKTDKDITIIEGGTTRGNSVAKGLNLLNEKCSYVAIHDGARPWIMPKQISKVLECAKEHGAAASGRPITDTIKKCDKDSTVIGSISREFLWAMETPQIFRYQLIKEAYDFIIKKGIEVTDEVSAINHYGKPVKIVKDEWKNPKITFPEDLDSTPPSH